MKEPCKRMSDVTVTSCVRDGVKGSKFKIRHVFLLKKYTDANPKKQQIISLLNMSGQENSVYLTLR